MYNIPAIIFAGGKSSRMGEDKALLPFKSHKTLSEFQYQKLQQYFNTVYLSSKAKKFTFTCDVILDIYSTSSPLVALTSIFKTLDSESIFVLSVDAPLVNRQVIDKLFHAYDKRYDAIIAQSPNGLQPLCGIYNRSILSLAEDSIKKDIHKLTRLLKLSNTCTVSFEDESLFTNLNYKEEYEKLLLR